MGRSAASRVSNHEDPDLARGHPSRRAPKRAPQDEDYFPGTLLFFTAPFLPFALPVAAFLGAAPIAVAFATFRAFGRLRIAARCAAANAALAQPVSSSGSSN